LAATCCPQPPKISPQHRQQRKTNRAAGRTGIVKTALFGPRGFCPLQVGVCHIFPTRWCGSSLHNGPESH